MKNTDVIHSSSQPSLDVFGPVVQFLTPLEEKNSSFVMHGTLPAGAAIPLHSHADTENFYVVSGSLQVLKQENEQAQWVAIKEGDFVHIPGNVKHAFRTGKEEKAEMLIITTFAIGRFFKEIGRPLTKGEHLPPPSPEELQHFQETSDRFGYWNATPEENKKIGIQLPGAD